MENDKSWLKENGFSNIETTPNNRFIKANGRDNKILVIIKDGEFPSENNSDIYRFAYKNNRKVWVLDVIGDQEVKWSLYE